MSDKFLNSNSRECFACGKENPIGLKLCFEKVDNGVVTSKFTPANCFIGFKGVLHGGIISTVLDEAMAWALHAGTDKWYVTSQMTVNFKKSSTVNESLVVRAWVTKEDGTPFSGRDGEKIKRIQYARAELKNSQGEVLATSGGKFFQLPDEKTRELFA